MFTHGRGEMFEWLQRSGRDMSDCGARSPVQHLGTNNMLGEKLIAAHVNHLGRGDIALLAQGKVSIAHCPRSHAYFHHAPFPLHRLKTAGVNVCLGTDSLVRVYKKRGESIDLNMFAEMRALAAREPSLSAQAIVQMATINGARALHLLGEAGELRDGCAADMIAIPFSESASKAYASVVHHQGAVSASLIGGKWALPPAGL
jgi:cytosine/adenosine deaminase-related metal-dependent hydrolase